MYTKKILFSLVALLMVFYAAFPAPVNADGKSEYWVDESTLPFDAYPGFEDTTRLWGVHAGAGYRIEVPANWNGDLVMWAHGLGGRLQTDRLFFDPVDEDLALREYFLINGYAWAASTYSKNNWEISQGVKDTHALATLFNGLVGMPAHVYITGRSLGALITAVSIEQYRNFYSGALALCGPIGNYDTYDTILDLNLAAQQIALGSSSWPLDRDEYFNNTVPAIIANLEAGPGTWPVGLNADGQAFKQLVELRTGGDRPNFEQAWFFYNVIPSVLGTFKPGQFLFETGLIFLDSMPHHSIGMVDNTDFVYQTDLDPAISAYEQNLNDSILRVAASPEGRINDGLSSVHVPPVTGNINTPIMTMHNLGDMVAPFQIEIDYREEVSSNGKDHLLVQRAYRGVNHCGFTLYELETAFSDLVMWVETGIKPLGDPVGDPQAVAASDFGCQFTDPAGGHLLAQPCP